MRSREHNAKLSVAAAASLIYTYRPFVSDGRIIIQSKHFNILPRIHEYQLTFIHVYYIMSFHRTFPIYIQEEYSLILWMYNPKLYIN